MTMTNFINGLKRNLPEDTWPWVFAALRHDPLIWRSLDGYLGQRVLEMGIKDPEDVSPAALAFTLMEYPLSPIELRSLPMQVAPEKPTDIDNLDIDGEFFLEAAGIALQIRERRLSEGSWDNIARELLRTDPTALACLYGIIPDQLDFLLNLLASDRDRPSQGRGIKLVLHTVLSNPLPPSSHIEVLSSTLANQPEDKRLEMVRQISTHRHDLARTLAKDLHLSSRTDRHTYRDDTRLIQQIELTLRNAEVQFLAGDPTSTVSSLEQTIRAARHLQAQNSAILATVASIIGDSDAALKIWRQANELEPENPEFVAGLALTLIQAGRTADAQALLAAQETGIENFLLNLAHAKLEAARGHTDIARQFARQAVTLVNKDKSFRAGSLPNWLSFLSNFTELLLNLDLPTHAIQVAELESKCDPNNAEVLSREAQAHFATGNTPSALQTISFATTQAPENQALQKQLIEILEINGDWEIALIERANLVEKLDTPTSEELYNLAYAALKAGEAARAAQLCEHLIMMDASDGLSRSLLGEASLALGNTQAALENLEQAVELNPQEAAPWLALVNFYHQANKSEKVLEVLRSAAHSTPDQPEIQLALGEALLHDGSMTHALAVFRRAGELINPNEELPVSIKDAYRKRNIRNRIALRTGSTMRQLGHLEEARQILESAHQKAPYDLDLAYEFALTLLDLSEFKGALEPLSYVLESEPTTAEPYLKYANAVLSLVNEEVVEIDLQRALTAVRRALEISPELPEGIGLLAETLAASGDNLAAMGAYQNALDTILTEDPVWQARLSLGLGSVALQLGQTETALAALQEANQIDPLNPKIQHKLSDAYAAAGLTEDAFQSARAALLLAPTDIQNLTWYANQVLSLKDLPGFTSNEAQDEAINALKQASNLAPYRTDLMVLLGGALLKAGNTSAAREAFRKLIEIDEPASKSLVNDLYRAAQGLLELNDPSGAAECLERALQSTPDKHAQDDPSLLILLSTLASAHYQSGNLESSLQALDQAIQLAPQQADLHMHKSSLLLEIASMRVKNGTASDDTIQKALASAKAALEFDPMNVELLRQAGIIFREAGDLPAALEIAEQLIDLSQDDITQIVAARSFAAELARAMIHPDQARAFLAYRLTTDKESLQSQSFEWLDFHLLHAELAIDSGQDQIAIDMLGKTLDLAPNHPRLLAIQSRLSLRRDDQEAALDIFQDAIQNLDRVQEHRLKSLISVAETAAELGEWDTALDLWGKTIEIAPLEPINHLSLARTLVLRAEFQLLCQSLEIITHAPGEASISQDVYIAFTTAIQHAENLISNWESSVSVNPLQVINRWNKRGQAVFHPTKENANALAELSSQADDVIAQIACLQQIGDIATGAMTARAYPHSPAVLLQLASSLSTEKPRQALAAAQAAYELLASDGGEPKPRPVLTVSVLKPLVHFTLARLYHREGNRSGDRNQAIEEIQKALTYWPDEPLWHSWAAEISMRRDLMDPAPASENAIFHLQRAIDLHPSYIPPYLSLGAIYLELGAYRKTIECLNPIRSLAAEMPELWVMLSKAHHACGELEPAAEYADKAISLSPGVIEPLLIRGEIALQAGDPKAAEGWTQAALRIDPEDENALLIMARILNALDRPEDALALIDQALPRSTNKLTMFLERIRLLLRSRGRDEALLAIRNLAKDNPAEPTVLAFLAEMCAEASQPDEAIQAAQRALQANNNTQKLTIHELAKIHHLLGKLFRQSGQLDQSVYHLTQALQLDPWIVETYLELGIAYQDRREHDLALETFEQAIEIAPDDHRAYYQIGLALKESKDYLRAEKMLRRAAELGPHEPSIHRLLAAVVALNLVHNRREVIRDVPMPF